MPVFTRHQLRTLGVHSVVQKTPDENFIMMLILNLNQILFHILIFFIQVYKI